MEQVIELSLHEERLRASAAVLAIPLPKDLEEILVGAVAELCVANGLDGPGAEVAVRVPPPVGALIGRALCRARRSP